MSPEHKASKSHSDIGFAGRLQRAILQYQSQIGRRVTYEELASLVSKAEGRKPPYAKSAFSEWVQGRSEPKLTAIRAIAAVLNVSAAWLAFGEELSLDIDESQLRYLTDDEIARAERIVAERAKHDPTRRAVGEGRKGGGKPPA